MPALLFRMTGLGDYIKASWLEFLKAQGTKFVRQLNKKKHTLGAFWAPQQ